jgi:phosphocarrier protein HPr
MATSNDVVIHHKVGLHARPAALFVKTAAGFSSRITLENLTRGTQPVNAKSILSVLSAGVKMDDQIRIAAEGADEAAAVTALSDLVNSNFGETE